MTTKIPVVVVGGSANALGVLRSLPHCDLHLLCDSEQAPAWHSRWGQKHRSADTKAPTVVDELMQLASRISGGKPVLLLTEEKTVVQVSAARERLAPFYHFVFCDPAMLLALQSKSGFQQLANQVGAAIPQGRILTQLGDLALIEDLNYPCVFKPLEQNEAYGRRFKKAYKVGSAAEVASLYPAIAAVMPQMIVQEWLEGADSDIYFCLAYFDAQGKLVSSFTGRKIRSWPLQVGGTASCTAAPEAAAELTEKTVKFCQAIGYIGQMGMEFKYDAHRGGFYMIEPTVGRTDYQHEIATLAGSNVLAAMVDSLAGKPLVHATAAQNTFSKKVVWYDEIADANALANGGSNVLFLDYQRVAAVWRWSDPTPGLMSLWRRLKRKLS
jgi:predicted ATP-grasp superfamily ATP-dependent carboligase